jgi:hypothetical protein
VLLKVDATQGKGNEIMTKQERMERAERIMQDHRKAIKLHHKACYNKEEFKWLWYANGIPHTGIWAFGGYNKDELPKLAEVLLAVPASDPQPGWYCYIGPIPEFSNTIYYDEHLEGTQVNG